MRRMSLAVALASVLASGRGGVEVLKDMMTPRFDIAHGGNSLANAGKHRNSGRGSPRPKYGNNAGHGTAHCGAKQCLKYAKQNLWADINQHYEARMRWNETVYPRVLELQAKQRLQAQGTR